MRLYIDDKWQFYKEYNDAILEASYKGDFEEVRIPHSVAVTPLNYFDESIYQMVSGYKRTIHADEKWRGQSVILTFDAIAHDSVVYLNGKKVGEHHCGYTAFSINLSKQLKYGEDNELVVRVDSRENLNIPPFGFVIDYMTYGGIYRDVYLDIRNTVHVSDIYIHPEVKTNNDKVSVKMMADITVANFCTVWDRLLVRQTLTNIRTKDKQFFDGIRLVSNEPVEYDLKDVELWSPENPVLYELKTELVLDGKTVDTNTTRCAFRSSEFRKDGYYLNGKKYKIRGLNRHQSYAHVGYAMPKSMQVMDARVLKEELALNAVRTSHYPQSHYFLDACDELGLLVFTEIPGWQHIGNEEWKHQACKNVADMILQYRNHPSIVIWGVRINESKDDDEFYTKTNEIAHRLDPYRPTGGVKAGQKMSCIEDVYNFNDFSHYGTNDGCLPKKKATSDDNKPYFVTEYNGHMYPTKSFDWEEHRREHAIRHANVLDAVASHDDICGSFGWCMADYNTHKDFGSGDRICYHGVLDMYRNPKMAASVYAAQGKEDDILEISSSMDIGEHPACNSGKSYIFTNADSVKMYKNGRFIKEYTGEDSEHRHMISGPILINDVLGDVIHKCGDFKKKQADAMKTALNGYVVYGQKEMPLKSKLAVLKGVLVYHMGVKDMIETYIRFVNDWGGQSTSYRFEAIKDGEVVKTVIKEPMTSVTLEVIPDHDILTEDQTYDVAELRIRAIDQNGNLLNYYQEPVNIELSGEIELIGQKTVSLKGGMTGIYVKTTGKDVALSVEVKDINTISISTDGLRDRAVIAE